MARLSRIWTDVRVAIAILVLANLVVVGYLLIRDPSGAPSGDVVIPTVNSTREPVLDPPTLEPGVDSEPTAPATSPVEALPTPRQLAVVDATTAWRVTLATCGETGGPIVKRTVDGGATWQDIAVGSGAATRLLSQSAASALLVGTATTGDCAPAAWQTTDSGSTWTEFPDGLANTWYLDPATRSSLVGPAATAPVPCGDEGAIDLGVSSSNTAVVLCRSGALALSSDGGAQWASTDVTAAEPYAIVGTGDEVLVAHGDAACTDGVAISRYGVTGGEGASLEAAGQVCAPVLPGDLGALAIGAAEDEIWVWGATLARSSDRGATWQ